jgi:hypothetical protein
MGHQLLGLLPATRSWTAVVGRIAAGADTAEVAAATASAAESSLARASDDPTLRHAFFLLARIPLAARETSLGPALRALGLRTVEQPSLVEVVSAMVATLDEAASTGQRTDLGEMAMLAAAESLASMAGREGPSLFGTETEADDVQAALRTFSNQRQFALLARDFFSRLLRRCLDYFLSRAMAAHVGTGKRFPSIRDHDLFDHEMQMHCREVSLIVENFVSGWYGKHAFGTGITRREAGGFVHVAFEKLRAELRNRAQQPAYA